MCCVRMNKCFVAKFEFAFVGLISFIHCIRCWRVHVFVARSLDINRNNHDCIQWSLANDNALHRFVDGRHVQCSHWIVDYTFFYRNLHVCIERLLWHSHFLDHFHCCDVAVYVYENKTGKLTTNNWFQITWKSARNTYKWKSTINKWKSGSMHIICAAIVWRMYFEVSLSHSLSLYEFFLAIKSISQTFFAKKLVVWLKLKKKETKIRGLLTQEVFAIFVLFVN